MTIAIIFNYIFRWFFRKWNDKKKTTGQKM